METSTWVAIYLPLLIVLITSLEQFQVQRLIVRRRMQVRKKGDKGTRTMNNELLKSAVGKNCRISTGSYGSTIVGRVTEVNDNWVSVETRKGTELVNAEFIQNIRILPGV